MSPIRRPVFGGVLWGLVVVCCGSLIVPRLVSAERRDPLPSPLYQHSLKTSIDKFDNPAGGVVGGKVSRERAEAAFATGGGTQRLVGIHATVEDCWLAQAVFILSFNPGPAGCDDGEAYSFGSDPGLPNIMRREGPPYLPAPNPPNIPIEMVAMDLRGGGSIGPVNIRRLPSQPAPGQITNVTSDAGGNFVSGDSFFDIFYEIDLPGLGTTGHTQIPIELVALNLSSLPPIGHQFSTQPSQPPVQIFDPNNIPIGWICAIPMYQPVQSVACPPSESPTMVGTASCHGTSTCPGSYTCLNATCAAIQTCQAVSCTAEPTCAGSPATCSANPTCQLYPSCPGTPTCLSETCVGASSCRGTTTCPGTSTCEQIPTYQALSTCPGYPCTMGGHPSCMGPTYHGSATCPGSYTCKDASCAAFQTCINPTCTSEPTCSARTSTCSYTPTCPEYPSCEGTSTCGASISTCIGSSTCQGSTTCAGAHTCEPPAPTQGTYASCGNQPTCDVSVSCDGSVSCATGPSCDGGYTCQGTISCDNSVSCDGTPSCSGTPSCEYSCENNLCGYPTMRGYYSCGETACPTYISAASCAGGWLCPTYSSYNTCPAGSCITLDGTVSCANGPACITWAGYYTCHVWPCDVPPQPTYTAYETCRPSQCITWMGSQTCPGDILCIATVAPMASCGGFPTCAALACLPTIPGNPTCAGVASCAPNPSCNAFGTCAGFATCAPAGTCGANTCPNFNTCAGFVTCTGSATCDNGHTCAGNVTCAGANTCVTGSVTCQGAVTCDLAATCGGWPTCAGTFTCGFAAVTCAGQATCMAEATCPGAPTCNNSATCNGSPTCALYFTCGGWPTCQEPPFEIPCEIKLCLDSITLGWIANTFPPDSTQAFEWDDWHSGPIHPLLIWDEMSPKIPGEFVITEWIAPPPQAGIVDTEYVRFPYWVTPDSVYYSGGIHPNAVIVGDYILLTFKTPAGAYGQSAWFRVREIGKSRPQDKKYILKLICERPTIAVACACNCHADPVCDGFTDVLDIVSGVNIAFRNAPAIPDPNPLCPVETTDTDCDGDTDVLDVIHLVNVAFRNADPALEFCDPCP